MPIILFRVLLLSIFVAASSLTPVRASCVNYVHEDAPYGMLMSGYDYVFSGIVTSANPFLVSFDVHHVWEASTELGKNAVMSLDPQYSRSFAKGSKYLVFASLVEGYIKIETCNPTKEWSHAESIIESVVVRLYGVGS